MREIECVRIESVSPGMDKYLKTLIKEAGCEAKLLSWNSPDVGSNTPLIILSSPEHLSGLKKIFTARDEKVIVALNSRKDFKLVSELKSDFSKIFGFIDISQEVEYNVPILKNYLNMNFSKHTLKIEKLANDLDRIYEFTQSQLTKIKDLHDRFVKIRTDKLKGITLSSKFMAGEKSGGEFFDVIQSENELLFIQAGSDSYLLSSMILSEIEILKEKSNAPDLNVAAEKFQKVINHHANENKAELTYCIMNLNLKNLQASFALRGQGYIFFQNELISFNEPMKLKLKPRERLVVISQGAMENLKLLNPKLMPKKFFMDNSDKETRELITEFFFEISRNKAGNFLIYDALLAVVEIEENILYQLS
ncbi:MAG: hypothetical protein WC635_05570 [Bacteriovorax sp.]|jgi:hypothetical protein